MSGVDMEQVMKANGLSSGDMGGGAGSSSSAAEQAQLQKEQQEYVSIASLISPFQSHAFKLLFANTKVRVHSMNSSISFSFWY